MVFVLHAWFVRAAPRPDACAQVPGKATETVLRRAAGLACCGHGGSARQANLKQGLPVALGRVSGCCSLQLNSAQACLLVSYMPLVNSSGIRSHLLLSVMILTIFTNWISGKRAAPRQALRSKPGERGIACGFVFPTRTILRAATRTDDKYLVLTRIDETTLTRQLVGLKFSLKWAVKSSSLQPFSWARALSLSSIQWRRHA